MSNPQFSDGMGVRRWSEDNPRHVLGLLMVATTLVTGMFLGRFLTKSEMRRDIVRLEAQLSERQAEIDALRSEAMQPPPQQGELDRLRDQHRQLVTQFDELALQFQMQKSLIGRAIRATEAEQKLCLDELRQFQQANTPLSAEAVLQFTERMFATRRQMLDALAGGRDLPTADAQARTAPTMPQGDDETGEPHFTFAPDETDNPGTPSLPTSAATPSIVRQPETPRFTFRNDEASALLRLEPRQESQRVSQPRLQPRRQGDSAGPGEPAWSSGVFFGPRPSLPQKTGYTYFAPRQQTRAAPSRRPRAVFTDRADDTEGPLLR